MTGWGRSRDLGATGAAALGLLVAGAVTACGGGASAASDPEPSRLRGQTVLVLPVQHVDPGPSGRPAGRDAARQADAEIAFALSERGASIAWVFPDRLAEVMRRRPSLEVDPYALSADEVREQGDGLQRIGDPLYGEIRAMAALFDARFAVWPVELAYTEPGAGGGRLTIRALLLDARGGDVLWHGRIEGGPHAAGSPAALASAAQRFAERFDR